MEETDENYQQLVTRIIKEYDHENYEIDLKFGNINLKNFRVLKNVFRPNNEVNINLINWLIENKKCYLDKVVIDMGCGSGILGVVTGLSGAKEIIFADLSPVAVKNTKENVKKFNLENKSYVIKTDLFQRINKNVDLIIFNHPFFLDYIIENLLLKKPIFKKAKLIHKFLKEARDYLLDEGIIIMPYLHLAGKDNDPGIQASKHSYSVEEVFKTDILITGGRKGPMSIYRITPNK